MKEIGRMTRELVLVFSHLSKKVNTSNMKDSWLIQCLKVKGNCGGKMEKCLKESSRMELQLRKWMNV